jgi:hypothetical protein
MTERYFTDTELKGLSRTPRQELEAALRRDPAAATETAVSIARSYKDQIGGSQAWIATVLSYMGERSGKEGIVDLVGSTSRLFQALAGSGVPLTPDVVAEDAVAGSSALVTEIAARASSGDTGGALAAFDAFEAACRVVQDVYRDWLTALLTSVYRRDGPDELESVHRYCAERTLLPWMSVDIRNSPAKRLVRWVRMLKGHFSGVEVTEDDEKFTLLQNPCGTCSRQVLQGRYQPPVDLAVVEEIHTVTWGRGTTPVYRTHVPVWHVAMARERLGVPWPVNQCPKGLGSGPCPTLLFKDPLNPRANAFVPGVEGDYEISASP